MAASTISHRQGPTEQLATAVRNRTTATPLKATEEMMVVTSRRMMHKAVMAQME
jgi:hypothetical protein